MIKNPNIYQKGKTIVYFVRHGDRLHILGNKELGLRHPGPGLSRLGRKQAKQMAKSFKKIKNEVDVIYCSNMTRAIETAEELAKILGKKPAIIPELSEFNDIVWKKKFYSIKYWKHFIKYHKAKKAFDRILEKNKKKVIVIVAHGNIIKGLLLKHKYGLSFNKLRKIDCSNCHVSRARFLGKNLDFINYFNAKDMV